MVRLTAMMPVRNEAGRYLEEVLQDLSAYVDDIVVLDDASTDGTPDICRSFPKVTLHRNPEPVFPVDESALRKALWRHTVAAGPGWVLALDADEIFEERMRQEVTHLVGQDEYDAVEFRLFDFWGGRTHCRVDGGWDPWAKRVRLLFRHRPEQTYSWPRHHLHCGRIPVEVRGSVPVFQSDLRVMHFGWVRPEDIRRKYEHYRQLHSSPHLESVFDPPEKIRLEPWIPGKRLPF